MTTTKEIKLLVWCQMPNDSRGYASSCGCFFVKSTKRSAASMARQLDSGQREADAMIAAGEIEPAPWNKGLVGSGFGVTVQYGEGNGRRLRTVRG